MRLLKTPFLPEKKVSYVIASGLNKQGREYLLKNDINIIEFPEINTVDKRLCRHSDLFCFPLSDKLILCKELLDFKFDSELNFIDKIYLDKYLNDKYPGDVLLNCVSFASNLISDIDTVSPVVLQYFANDKIINVKQGYTKCSVCPVNENSFITDDLSVYEKCKDYYDVLLIDKGYVRLDGFDYGFTGGASGKLSKNLLAFTGRFYDTAVERKIINFCNNRDVECVRLSDERIYDIGSIIPLTEDD